MKQTEINVVTGPYTICKEEKTQYKHRTRSG